MSFDSSRTSDMSDDSLSAAAPDGAIGLSDAQYSSARRKMLDLINRLHATGVQADMDLPLISVIGSQSAGKSSLIESISGIKLPRASGTCTRCPTECRLSSSDNPWQCIVSLRFITDDRGQALGQARNEQFGDVIKDKSRVEERIRRAQRAILNPSTPSRQFLEGPDEDFAAREVMFSSNCISLQISGSEVADLSFCDLPGMIASGPDKEIIENLVISYIERPSCIILVTVNCEYDWENQRGFDLAQEYDPDGKRTIGVLTKPDRISAGDQENWLRFIRNDYKPLENGWFSVKQPDTIALQEGITWEEARAKEREYFSFTPPWSTLEYSYQQQLGTANLTERLSSLLSALIAKRLPELQDELQKLIQKTEEGIRQLPKAPSQDALTEIIHLLADFSQDLAICLEGTPNEDGLLQRIRPHEAAFKRSIRSTAPDFKAISAADLLDPTASFHEVGEESSGTLEFLANEEGRETMGLSDRCSIYIDEVMKRANQAITRELPDHHPFIVANEYITSIICKWQLPAEKLHEAVYQCLLQRVKALTQKHFGKFSQGGLHSRVTVLVVDYMKKCGEETRDSISWLLNLEKRPRTLNDHYYTEYRDKFLAHYKGCRRANTHGSLISNLAAYDSGKPPSSYSSSRRPVIPNFAESTKGALSRLQEINISCKAADLPKLLPSDPYEPALHIMATVRAYFQVAYKRFVDNISNAIDQELVLSLARDRGLEGALLQGLGITSADGHARCKEFLQEHPQVVTRREELQKRWERLDSAKRELMEMWM
ncbi:uncharacterized protein PHACADRAFT_197992 [Phanerochaete carnosa HHB-10118-sp]|uniref:GED domain-containing protein n=1 Tax=Phanerochaete carnosa (strain HHB-10118-sp) TaxID=650164 RepID=K5WT12_PHACS|nr:uncharacterized protein PHACADRAFT_197992 [Phanerochaete carnosa HHB-10118-sp]EKM53567.1 hypothetical protein PHACADRAFT_197992 [Phanerochaete carnosa HHB-10118-sp]